MNYKVKQDVNIRSGPGTQYDVVGTANKDDLVLGADPTGWVVVQLEPDEDGDSGVGWINGQYVEVYTAPIPQPATPTKPAPTPAGVVTGQMVVAKAMTQKGKPYIFGYEVNLDDPNPAAFDCSEFVEWICHQLKIKPTMPDGAANQQAFCERQGTLIPVATAIRTPGALLFRITGENHVVVSRGDGSTIEAMGKDYGVVVGGTEGRTWTHGARIPGVTYA